MATAQPACDPETTLEIRRTFKAPREKVFQAWTQAEGLSQWHAPTPEHKARPRSTCASAASTASRSPTRRVPSTSLSESIGKSSSPRKLVYSWSWEDGSVTDTLVTVACHDRDGGTEVVLTHEFMPNQEWRDKHVQGWTGCLSTLENYLA